MVCIHYVGIDVGKARFDMVSDKSTLKDEKAMADLLMLRSDLVDTRTGYRNRQRHPRYTGAVAPVSSGLTAIIAALSKEIEAIDAELTALMTASQAITGKLKVMTERLHTAIAQAGQAGREAQSSGQIRLPRASGAEALTLIAMPQGGTAGAEMGWTFARPPTVPAMVGVPHAAPAPPTPAWTEIFGLTTAEAAVAAELLAGRNVTEIAAHTRRSVHTVRAHLSQLLAKTQTSRQSELIRLLLSLKPAVAEGGCSCCG